MSKIVFFINMMLITEWPYNLIGLVQQKYSKMAWTSQDQKVSDKYTTSKMSSINYC
jgi:hypothetical protein